MAIADDFSFPKLITPTTATTNNYVPQFSISSQSMWRASSLIYPHNSDEDDHNSSSNEAMPRKHKSFSEVETGESELRMDLLWQDFNERELKRVSSLDGRVKARSLSRSGSSTSVKRRASAESGGGSLPDRHCFAPGLGLFRVSERRSSLVIRTKKRTSTVVFLRALRKLFSAHHLGREKKKE